MLNKALAVKIKRVNLWHKYLTRLPTEFIKKEKKFHGKENACAKLFYSLSLNKNNQP